MDPADACLLGAPLGSVASVSAFLGKKLEVMGV